MHSKWPKHRVLAVLSAQGLTIKLPHTFWVHQTVPLTTELSLFKALKELASGWYFISQNGWPNCHGEILMTLAMTMYISLLTATLIIPCTTHSSKAFYCWLSFLDNEWQKHVPFCMSWVYHRLYFYWVIRWYFSLKHNPT